MVRRFTVVIERDEDGIFVGSVPGLVGCHTQGKSLDELMERIRECIELCLEVQGENTESVLELVGVQSIAV
ncbi:MAG: type II toxin-antitoxin system HicB family antitoxin [Dehalococcoidia bacterium]|nr:type II toxin-antitoxin system HicB family antitoxin [Dehalococcoidia bacterium]